MEWGVVEYIDLEKSCPFCGCARGELLQLGDTEYHQIECAFCWASVKGEDKQKAFDNWNRRAS